MRTFRTVIVVAALALLVSACNALIPDQPVTNPLGLNNSTITLNQTSTAGITPQAAASTTFSGSTSSTVKNIDASGIPGWASPSGFTTSISATGVTIKPGTAATLPSTLDVTQVTFGVTVTDGSSKPSVTVDYNSGQQSQILVLTQSSCGAASADGCSYSVAAGSDLTAAADLIPLSLTPAQVGTLWTIITAGGSPNDVSATAGVTVNAPLPAGTQMVVKLGNASGTLTF